LKLFFSTLHTHSPLLVSFIHFFEIDNVILNKKKKNKFKGERVYMFGYRLYSIGEISAIL
jgi:hypothetical protein